MVNGHRHDDLTLGMILGRIEQENGRQTEILLATLREMQSLRWDLTGLPDRIAARLPPPPSPPPARFTMAAATKLLHVVLPFALLAALCVAWAALMWGLPRIREMLS